MAKSSYRGDSRGKMTCQRPSLRAETSIKIWMSGLNPNYNTTPLNSARIYRRNSERISLSCDWRRHFAFAVPTSGTTSSDKIAWFPANNSIDYTNVSFHGVWKKCNTDSQVCATAILRNPKKLFITLLLYMHHIYNYVHHRNPTPLFRNYIPLS